jgi:hypothetical protein
VQVVGKRDWWIGTVVGVEPGFGVVECGEWTTKRARSPCGLIASARGWLVVEKMNNKPMAGRFILRMQPVGYFYKHISFCCFIMIISTGGLGHEFGELWVLREREGL